MLRRGPEAGHAEFKTILSLHSLSTEERTKLYEGWVGAAGQGREKAEGAGDSANAREYALEEQRALEAAIADLGKAAVEGHAPPHHTGKRSAVSGS
jgi:hypothetical protein